MSILLLKSILALVLFLIMLVSLLTMLEVFGRPEHHYPAERMKRLHQRSGYFYILLFLLIAFLCLRLLWATQAELSLRGVLHSVLALAIAGLLTLKIGIIRTFKGWHEKVPTLGLGVAWLTVIMVGLSAGIFLVQNHFGLERPEAPPKMNREATRSANLPSGPVTVPLDEASIRRGAELFNLKCRVCHETASRKQTVGPGLQGILKGRTLPVSGKPATPDNVLEQLDRPYNRMPSFKTLAEAQRTAIIAYLNTL